MKLNTEKIINELSRVSKTQSWLANQLGITRQYISYILKKRPITWADRIAKILNMNPRDLIK